MKRNFILAVIIIISSVFLVMCKNDSGAGTPRLAYVTSVDGAAVKKNADTGAENVCIVPFGAAIEVTDKSGSPEASRGWVKAKWESTEGWVKIDGTGDMKSLLERIGAEFNNDRKNLSEKVTGAFSGVYTVKAMYLYTGGEMEPAAMMFLSNGVLALNTTIFSEKQQVNFLRYEFLSDGRLVKIYFGDDSRISFPQYRVVEEGNSTVFKIIDDEKSIIYQVKDGSVNFFNWIFVEKK